MNTEQDYTQLTIGELASLIHSEMRDKPHYTYARPYVMPLLHLQQLKIPRAAYGMDDYYGIILYALSNLAHWRGVTARAVKAELNKRLKEFKTSRGM